MPDVTLTSGVDSSGVQRGMAELSGHVQKAEAQIKGSVASMFATGALTAFAAQIFSLADKLQDLSQRFGVSTTILQQFGNAAETNGSSMEAVAQAFNKLEIARSKALGGNEAMLKSFAALNVSLDDLKNNSPDEIMKKIGGSSLEAADLVKLLGKNALELRPLLSGIADGSIELGNAMSESVVKSLADAHDQFTELKQTLTIFGGQVLGTLVKSWQQGMNSIAASALAGKELVVGSFEAIQRALHFDFAGARNAISNALSNAGAQIQTGAQTNAEIEAGGTGGTSAPARRPVGGTDADASDDFGNATGRVSRGGGGASNETTLRSRLAQIERERYEASITAEQKLRALANERAILEGFRAQNAESGLASTGHDLELQVRIAEINKEQDALNRQIDKTKQTALEKSAAAREEAEKEVVAIERQNEVLRLVADGHSDVAEHLQMEWRYADQINQAIADGNDALAEQLGIQRDLVQAANERAEAEARVAANARKWHEGLSNFAENAGTYDLSSFRQDAILTNLQRVYGQDFGTHGAAGGPSFREQLTIMAAEREAVERARNQARYGLSQFEQDQIRLARDDASARATIARTRRGASAGEGGDYYSDLSGLIAQNNAIFEAARTGSVLNTGSTAGGNRTNSILGQMLQSLTNIEETIEPPLG